MRRRWQDRQPKSMFRASELRWLFSGSLLLVLLYLLISRWGGPASAADSRRNGQAAGRRPANERAVARERSSMPLSRTRQDAAAAPRRRTEPTDEDPDEAETAKEEFQAITDGTLTLGREEMDAYYRLVTWVENQSFAELQRRARRRTCGIPIFTTTRAGTAGNWWPWTSTSAAPRIWERTTTSAFGCARSAGVTDESRTRLYAAVIVDFPKGMPIGTGHPRAGEVRRLLPQAARIRDGAMRGRASGRKRSRC